MEGLPDGRAWAIVAIVGALIVARFVWVFASDAVVLMLRRVGIGREDPIGVRCATIMGWAGMRGVVTLAAALTLPTDFPGRDVILLVAFATILVTVLVQGSTLGVLIRWLGVRRGEDDEPPMDLFAAEQEMMHAQLAVVEQLARNEQGQVVHPQLLRRYTARAKVGIDFIGTQEERVAAIASHFDVIIEAVRAGRSSLVRLHRANLIDDETMRDLEHDLDLEEMGAIASKA